MASSSHSWLPFSGTHPVAVGATVKRSLSGPEAAKAKFGRNYFAFRYNFKPPSIDGSKPAHVHINRGQDNTSVQVDFPDTPTVQANGTTDPPAYHTFKGSETAAKEWDCVLIWDPDTQTLALEKIESFVNLTREGKVSAPSGSSSSAASTSSSPRKPVKRSKDKIDDVEQALLSTLEAEEEGELTESIREPKHRTKPKYDDDEDVPLAKTVKSKAPTIPQTRPSLLAKIPPKPKEAVPRYKQPLVAKQRKEAAKSQAPPAVPPPPAPLALPSSSGPASGPLPPPPNSLKSKQKQKTTTTAPPQTHPQQTKQKPLKTAPPLSSANTSTSSLKRAKPDPEPLEEPLEPAKPPKRSRPNVAPSTSKSTAPPPAKSEPLGGLALPGSTSSFAPPPAPVTMSKLASSRGAVPNVITSATTTAGSNAAALGLGDFGEMNGGGPEPGSESEEEEDGEWDEVQPAAEEILDDSGVPLRGMLSEGLIEVDGDDIFGGGDEGGEEIDLEFEREMDQQMNEVGDDEDGLGIFSLEVVGESDGEGDGDMVEVMGDAGYVDGDGDGDMEDFLEAEFEEVLPKPAGQPISLRQWAKDAGGEDGMSEDSESTSEEESDDD